MNEADMRARMRRLDKLVAGLGQEDRWSSRRGAARLPDPFLGVWPRFRARLGGNDPSRRRIPGHQAR